MSRTEAPAASQTAVDRPSRARTWTSLSSCAIGTSCALPDKTSTQGREGYRLEAGGGFWREDGGDGGGSSRPCVRAVPCPDLGWAR
jgi:hypothetical protein